jgi:hypothetical protein
MGKVGDARRRMRREVTIQRRKASSIMGNKTARARTRLADPEAPDR